METMLIIGGGAMGSVLSLILEKNGHSAHIYDTNPERSSLSIGAMESMLREAPGVLLCLTADNTALFLKEYGHRCKASAAVIAVAKGVSPEGLFMHELIENHATQTAPYLMVGPLLAEEIIEGMPTAGMLVGRDAEATRALGKRFASSHFAMETTADLHGAAAASVLKNCYTLLMGTAEGCGIGENARGVLFARALEEMLESVVALGGREETALGLAGAADFFASVASPHSFNRQAGSLIGKKGMVKDTEGTRSVSRLKGRLVPFPPLLGVLDEVLTNDRNTCQSVWEDLFVHIK